MTALAKLQPLPGLTLQQLPVPKPGPTDLLVQVRRAAICGSDIKAYAWDAWARNIFKTFPCVLGHEFSGVVVKVGSHVAHFKPGDRVSADTHVPCGRCYQCLTGEQHICQHMGLIGHTMDGCFAEYCLAPQSAARRIPDALSFDDATLLEPLGVALRPCVDGGSVTGQSVVVIGCGPIGLMAIGAMRASGAFPIIGIDLLAARRDIATRMGADIVLNPGDTDVTAAVLAATNGDGAGVIVDASGSVKAIADSLVYLRKGARYFMIGNAKETLVIPNVGSGLINKEIHLTGIHGRRMFSTWQVAESLLVGKRIDLSPIVTTRLPLERFVEGFEQLHAGTACKVLFEIS
jgi:threonine 3-dehydrogenase